MKFIHAAIAATLALTGFVANAQLAGQPAKPVPKISPNELYDWSNPYSDPTWRNGYSTGMIVATAKVISLLRQNNLTPLGVCFPAGMSNDDLVSIIRSEMAYETLPRYGGTIDNWDQEALLHAAVAALNRFPCR